MGTVLKTLDAGSRAVSFLLGGLAIALAFAAMATASSAAEITYWAGQVLGWTLAFWLPPLFSLCLFPWLRLLRDATTHATADERLQNAADRKASGIASERLSITLLGSLN